MVWKVCDDDAWARSIHQPLIFPPSSIPFKKQIGHQLWGIYLKLWWEAGSLNNDEDGPSSSALKAEQ